MSVRSQRHRTRLYLLQAGISYSSWMDRRRRIPRGSALVETQGNLETGLTTRISLGRGYKEFIIHAYLCYYFFVFGGQFPCFT